MYFLKKSSWTEEQWPDMINGNGYTLFLANHITDVCIHHIPIIGYVYLN